MQRVAIIAGSESDAELVKTSAENLDRFGIGHNEFIISAHRQPERCREFAISAADSGYCAIIAIAGLAAHLPGVIASMTHLPVIGVPSGNSALSGLDALLSIVQMPGSTPVATMAIGKHGAKNAAIFAARIIALQDKSVAAKLAEYRLRLAEGGK